jgi:hypothetical protein
MADDKTTNARVQEGYNHRVLSQVFNEAFQKGYNGEPRAQVFSQPAQGSAPGSAPAAHAQSQTSAPTSDSCGGKD